MRANSSKTLLATAAAVALALGGVGAAPSPQATTPGVEALDWAFTFASAIESDPHDRAMAQQWAVMDYSQLGALDRAVERAASVEGWRRGVICADLALELAREGRFDEARRLLAQADEVRRDTSGWQGPRISAHVAQVLAYLGDAERAEEIQQSLTAGDARQYRGRMVATVSAVTAAQGAEGNFRSAMDRLKALDSSDDLDTAWWRTAGYLELARGKRLDEAERREVLEATERSAAAVGGWKQAEVLTSLAEEWRERDRKKAGALLEQAEGLVHALADTAPAKGPMLGEIGASWARLGDEQKARALLMQALDVVPAALEIERPEIVGRIAASYATLGDAAEARRSFDRALALASELVNPRPRALSLTAILRSMARARVELDDATRHRLTTLLDRFVTVP